MMHLTSARYVDILCVWKTSSFPSKHKKAKMKKSAFTMAESPVAIAAIAISDEEKL